MPCRSAVAVVVFADEVAAADGLFIVCRRYEDIVVCLVGEVVNAGKPCLAEVVRLAVEADAEVIDIVGTPMNAAPVLVEGVSSVTYCERIR